MRPPSTQRSAMALSLYQLVKSARLLRGLPARRVEIMKILPASYRMSTREKDPYREKIPAITAEEEVDGKKENLLCCSEPAGFRTTAPKFVKGWCFGNSNRTMNIHTSSQGFAQMQLYLEKIITRRSVLFRSYLGRRSKFASLCSPLEAYDDPGLQCCRENQQKLYFLIGENKLRERRHCANVPSR